MKIAILPLVHTKKRASRQKATAFDDVPNTGLLIIKDVIEREYKTIVEYCSVATINNYDVVLVSLTGVSDAYNLVYTLGRYGLTADDVKPHIVIGGAGLINIKTFLEYGDYFVFGRGEKAIIDVIENIKDPKHELPKNVFKRGFHSFDQDFEIGQTDTLYPYDVPGIEKEVMLGCPYKCSFCFYTYSRKWIKTFSDGFFRPHNKARKEETWKDLEFDPKRIKYLSAIDGFSQRLRHAFNKPVTDELILEKFEEMSKVEFPPNKTIYFKIYQICGFPTETQEERQKFFEFMDSIAERYAHMKVVIYFVVTPFRAMPLTPAQHCEVDIKTNYRKVFEKLAGTNGTVCQRGNFRVYVTVNIDSPLSVLKEMIINRGGVEDSKLVKFLVLNKKIKSYRADEIVHYILTKYPNAEKLYRRYEIGEKGEWSYLHTYIPDDILFKHAEALEKRLGRL